MNKCPNCNADVQGKFCGSCGADVTAQSQQQQPPPPPVHTHMYHSHANPTIPTYADTSVMSVGDWLITYLVSVIPCVGFIMLIVWAASSNGNLNRRNYARAMLIIGAIALVLYLILWAVLGFAFFSIRDAAW